MHATRWIDGCAQDLRYAWRSLRQAPTFTITAILTLALGIGANTAIFSLVNGLMLRTLPVADPQRLAVLRGGAPEPRLGSGFPSQVYTYGVWEAMRTHGPAFDGFAAWSTTRFDLSRGGEMRRVDGLFTSGDFFSMLGVPALVGRTFAATDDVRGGGAEGAVAVISHGFWQRSFGGAANVVGTQLTIERVPFTVIGVTPQEFLGPEVGRSFDVAVPIAAASLIGRNALLETPIPYLRIMVRLDPGQGLDSATAILRGLQPQIREAAMPRVPGFQAKGFLETPMTLVSGATGTSPLRQRYERALMIIFAVVALVLLIACANIVHLLLARGAARRREWTVRLALGASRWRLARQLLVESVMLSAVGAGLGLLVAQWGSRALVTQLSTATDQVVIDLTLDWRILAFTIAVTATMTVIFGLTPAMRAFGLAPIGALRDVGEGRTSESRIGTTNLLVVAQVAVSLVLLVAAGLFVRTFVGLATLPLGFDAARVLVVELNATRANVTPADRTALYERLIDSIAALPGVTAAGGSILTPVSGNVALNLIQIPGAPALPERARGVPVHFVTPGWLATYGTALRSGRDIESRDRKDAPPVALVNEAFVRKFLPTIDPIGTSVVIGRRPPGDSAPLPTIVGVVSDAVYGSLRDPLQPTLYRPLQQVDFPTPPLTIDLSVRAASGSPALLARPIAATISTVDPDLAFSFRPLADQIGASLIQERVVATLSGFVGALAVLLAGLGLYGITAYAVTRRRIELGIRMALGADASAVVRLVLGRVTMLVGIGLVSGAVLTVWASDFISTLLFGVEARDPATLVGAATVLAAVAALAGWLPARRAARVDPAHVLRGA
jgi:putative ABC transport system permease protein